MSQAIGDMSTGPTQPPTPLQEALGALNDAAYAAIRAGADTTMYPDLDRQTLREICAATDKLVTENNAGVYAD